MGFRSLQRAVWAVGLFSAVGAGLPATAEDACSSGLIPQGCQTHCEAIRDCAADGDGSCENEVEALDACMNIEEVRVVHPPLAHDDFLNVHIFRSTPTIIGGYPVLETIGVLSFPLDEQTPHCGYVGNPSQGDCDCEANEVKANVPAGSFCRPSCPSGQTWADGLAHGSIYEGGGTCAVNHCVRTRDGGYTRLDARPSLSCFPDMRKEYVENYSGPFLCTALVGGASGAACWFAGLGIGSAIVCSAAGAVIDKIVSLCPDFPDPREG